jgi:predicted rRNA methylase YqxC with S4 and FtsJ domains
MEKIKTTLVQHGFMVNSIIDSPILGGDGNKEFLVHIIVA